MSGFDSREKRTREIKRQIAVNRSLINSGLLNEDNEDDLERRTDLLEEELEKVTGEGWRL